MITLRALTESEVSFQLDLEPDSDEGQFYDWSSSNITVTAAWTHPNTGELFTARAAVGGINPPDERDEAARQNFLEAHARAAELYEAALTNLNERLRESIAQAHELIQALRSPERAHFRATHRLVVSLPDGTEYIPVMLLPTGNAPCLREWAEDRPAEWRHVAGEWRRKGEPVANLKVEIRRQLPLRRVTLTLDVATTLAAEDLEQRLAKDVEQRVCAVIEAVRVSLFEEAQWREPSDMDTLELVSANIEVG